jgi:hypothetical protein
LGLRAPRYDPTGRVPGSLFKVGLAQYIHAILIQSPQIKVSFIGCGHLQITRKAA